MLDLGCGDGTISVMLKESLSAKEVYGVEIAPDAVYSAQQKGVKVFEADLDNGGLPFLEAFFDVVYCGEVIEHVFNPAHLLAEVYTVLKPNGVCVLTTPNLAGWSNRLALLFGYQPFPMAASPQFESAGKLMLKDSEGQGGHIRVLTLRALKDLVQNQGFEIKQVIGCPITVKSNINGLILKSVTSIDQIMSHFPSYASRIILILKKGN